MSQLEPADPNFKLDFKSAGMFVNIRVHGKCDVEIQEHEDARMNIKLQVGAPSKRQRTHENDGDNNHNQRLLPPVVSQALILERIQRQRDISNLRGFIATNTLSLKRDQERMARRLLQVDLCSDESEADAFGEGDGNYQEEAVENENNDDSGELHSTPSSRHLPLRRSHACESLAENHKDSS